jgi:hypothetical protein
MNKIFLKIIVLLFLIIITRVRSQSNTCTHGSSTVTCYNGGTCMTTGNRDCTCAPGYTGPTCLCKYKHLI